MNEFIKCPYCGETMSSGFVQSPGHYHLFFTKKPKKLWLVPQTSDGDITLGRGFLSVTCKALMCPKCKKVIIDYSQEER